MAKLLLNGETDYAQVIDEKFTSIADLKNRVEEFLQKMLLKRYSFLVT